MKAEALKCYALRVGNDGSVLGEDDPGAELHQRAVRHMREYSVTYAVALQRTLEDDKDLAARYARYEPGAHAARPQARAGGNNAWAEAGKRLDQLAKAKQAWDCTLSYAECFEAVCLEHPELAKAYGVASR